MERNNMSIFSEIDKHNKKYNIMIKPTHCKRCLKEVTVNKDCSLRLENIRYTTHLTSIDKIRIYCDKHKYLIGILPIHKVDGRRKPNA